VNQAETLSHGSVAQLLERFAGLRLLVLGDVMLDEYLTGHVERTSPEAPVPVVRAEDETSSLGGAANVAHLARALGAEAQLFGVVGDDGAGQRFIAQCEAAGIDADHVLVAETRPTTRKLRVLAQHQHVLRVDWEEHRPIRPAMATEVLQRLRALKRPDAMVISDYAKGLLTPEVLAGAISMAREWGVPVLVDPKYADLSRYQGATVIKANLKEFEASLGYQIVDHLEDELAAGSAAMLEVANEAAGVAVGKSGVAVVSPGELAARFVDGAHDKIISRDELASRVAWWRVQGQRIVFTNGCFDLLHVGHLHLLREAAREGDVLLVAVNSDESVRRLKGKNRPLISSSERTALLAALDCVDAVVVFDEDTPRELLDEVRPDVLAKGSDYAVDEVVGKNRIEKDGGKVVLIPLVPDRSTTDLVERIRSEDS
jgi:D-beta-D-heptose 7-phosphate kinase/D-beta-D-heptose 1-phosphate adenosyltransferase